MKNITNRLYEMQDESYRKFTLPLIPGCDPDSVIGVRAPLLKQYAKELNGTEEARKFMCDLPHRYHEENLLHGYLLTLEKDFETCLADTERFLPCIENWAVCDIIRPKALLKDEKRFLAKIRSWIRSRKTYTIRFGMEMLMVYFLDERFDPSYLKLVSSVRSEEYYVNMMIGWYFATALAKQWDHAIPYIEQHLLTPEAEKKAVRKSIESYRITPEQKEYLRSLLNKS
ncbi:MAG TPA: DNA alkylation repair protein [Erysipelotrichaceae bacterium]|nr:DNA alkylation repair protein [Erysipelotrichaceae bacterium]